MFDYVYIILIFYLRNFDLFARKIINVWGCYTSLDWQVKTTYSWCGLSGRKSLTNLTGVPSLTSLPPSLLFFRAPFSFTAPHYLNAWNRLLVGHLLRNFPSLYSLFLKEVRSENNVQVKVMDQGDWKTDLLSLDPSSPERPAEQSPQNLKKRSFLWRIYALTWI